MRKNILKLLIFMFCFAVLLTNAKAADNSASFSLTANKELYLIDDEIVIKFNLEALNVDAGDYLSDFNARVSYDADKISFSSITEDLNNVKIKKINDGQIEIKIQDATSTIINKAVLGTIRFRAKEAANTKINLEIITAKTSKDLQLTTKNSSYTVNIVKPKSKNNNLKSLVIKNNAKKTITTNEAFDSNTLIYTCDVPYTTSYVDVYPEAEDEAATVSVRGGLVLVPGKEQLVTITVKSESGVNKAYTITFLRAEEEKSDIATLDKLSVSGLDEFDFKTDKYSYTVMLKDKQEKLILEYETTDKKAVVEVVGNKSLKNKSKIKIIVTASDEKTKQEYIINIKKEEPEKIVKKEEPKKKTNIVIPIGIGITMLVIIIIITILFIRKRKLNKLISSDEITDELESKDLEESENDVDQDDEVTKIFK